LFIDVFYHATVVISYAFGAALVAAGIISYILPFLPNRSSPAVNGGDSISTPRAASLCIPSIRVIYWLTIGYCVQLVVINLGLASWVYWSFANDRADIANYAGNAFAVSIFASYSIALAAPFYYWYTFYGILQFYAHQKRQLFGVNGHELQTAKRFQIIFIICIVDSIVITIISLEIIHLYGTVLSLLLWRQIPRLVACTPYSCRITTTAATTTT
jgi:hypothetical protein